MIKKAGLILMLSFVLVLTLPSAVAENIDLTEREIEQLAPDTFGMLNNGIREMVFYYDDFDEVIIGDTKIGFFNTHNESITVNMQIESYWEERRNHSIRDNYTYGNIHNLNWVYVPEIITVNANSKYILPVTVELPKEIAYENSEDGGYICLITGVVEGYETAPSQKLFITLFGEQTPVPTPPMDIPGWVIWVGAVGLILGVIYFLYKKIEIVEIDEDGEEIYEASN